MFHAKTYLYILTVTIMASHSQSLFAMKDINEIKDHGLKIEKCCEKADDVFISPIKVFHIPFLKYKQGSMIQMLDKKTIIFADSHIIEVWDLENETCKKKFKIGNSENKEQLSFLTKLTNTSIIFRTNTGKVTIWDSKFDSEKTFKIEKTSSKDTYCHLIKLTETSLAAFHNDKTIEVWNIGKDPKCLKTIKAPCGCTEGQRLSDTKIIFSIDQQYTDDEIKILDLETESWPVTHVVGYDEMSTRYDRKVTCLLKNAGQIYGVGHKEECSRGSTIEEMFGENDCPRIEIYDTNSNKFIRRFAPKLTPLFLLNLPNHNAIISVNNHSDIEVWNLEKFVGKVQKIDCFKFFTDAKLVRIDYLEEENTITMISSKGLILMFQLNDKDLKKSNNDTIVNNLCDKFEKYVI